jgi:cation diffusion facilitator family transporter
MHHSPSSEVDCPVRAPLAASARERGVRAVVALTFVMMVLEIVGGYWTGSMALLADGWHMATHVAALGLAAAAYALARRYAAHRAFAFGTGKIHALAGYTSAVALGLVALAMVAEGCARVLRPTPVDYEMSLPVAVLGLLVNLASIRLLHGHGEGHAHAERHEHGDAEHAHAAHHHADEHEHDDENDHQHAPHERHAHGARTSPAAHAPTHGHAHGHDHNHRAALLHVVADALTSVLAIVALLAGRFGGYTWLDPAMGIVGGLVIVKWGASLCKQAAFDLLDVETSPRLEDGIRSTLEHIDDVRVSDLHVWSLGRGARGCIVTLVSSTPRESAHYRERLAPFGLAHLTVEVRQCRDGHA